MRFYFWDRFWIATVELRPLPQSLAKNNVRNLMYFWINFSWSAQNPRGFFRNRPRGVSHIIYAYGSKATDERSTYPVSKVKMDHIFDVKYVFEVLQNISKNQNISENINMFPISSCRKLIGFERVSTRAFQNRSKKWIISSLHQMRALFVQNVPKSNFPCGAKVRILLTAVFD